MDFLTTEEKALMVSDFADIITDPSIGGTINYRRYSNRADFDPTTGELASGFVNNWIYAIRAPVSEKQLQLSNGQYQTGDIRYMIKYTDITAPSKDDRIVDEEKTMYAIDILTDPLRIFHSVITRNVRGK